MDGWIISAEGTSAGDCQKKILYRDSFHVVIVV